MKILTAKYINGHLDLPEGSLNEGDVVTLLVPEQESEFSLTPEETARLQTAIAQAEKGESIDGWKLLDELRT
ncbi:MAG: hypothetical protein CMJ45_06380 [Planctomyces sp.]|mgnify:CR=1 FL=1|nr:hypothetical protein [Planctomyces sp.]